VSSESGTKGNDNDGPTDRPTYVHRPDGAGGTTATDTEAATAAGRTGTDISGEEPDGFGRAGWLLVVAVVVSTLVVPGAIYLFPRAPASLGLPFLATYLALPMVPAVILGLVAVWTMTGARRSE
jgi:hypothetical protein